MENRSRAPFRLLVKLGDGLMLMRKRKRNVSEPKSGGDARPRPPVQTKGSTGQFSLRSAGEAVVTHREEAAPAPPNKRIHARRPLPPVAPAPAEPATQSAKVPARTPVRRNRE